MKATTLIDVTRCTGCRGCQVSCKQWNQLPAETTRFRGTYENPPALSPITWTRVLFRERVHRGKVEWFFAKTQCMHCTDASCITVCPTGAAHRTPEGTVKVDPNRCIGCNYCVANCPFEVPRYDPTRNAVRKCTFCYDRITNGLKPACVQTCPTGALQFGDRQEMVRLAQRRVEELKAAGRTEARIYGLDEVAGTAVFYVLAEEPAVYGLVQDPQVPLTATLWGIIFKPVRVLAVAGAVVAGLLARRQQAEDQGQERGGDL
ncbi:MAG: 4Fe-4S dicluster domain-containing protein [bacterium]|nr:4Fe-4S dicluster domain-containing protein [bacterium]